MWIDSPPFRGAIVHGVGETQTVQLLEPRETVIEVLEDLKSFRCVGSSFIRNANGASTFPHRVAPPPERRK